VTEPKGPPASVTLMRLLAEQYWPSCTPGELPFVVRFNSPCIMIPLRGQGGSLRAKLAADYYRATGKAATNNSLADVIGVAEGMAQGQVSPEPCLRVARRDRTAYLDLGRPEGEIVVIRPGSWELSRRVPVLFRRSGLGRELPLPAEHGHQGVDAVRDLINIPASGEWAALVACRIASLLYPQTTHPLELFTANTSGSLKTSTARVVKDWIDPGLFIPVPKDGRSWAATAGNVYVAVLDNMSGFDNWFSDALARGTSGEDHADRALYTDSEAVGHHISIVPLITGIGLVPMRADLAERTMRHELRRPAAYLGDDEVKVIWQREHPRALAWLLDQAAAVAALHAYEKVERPRTGRLAVFEWTLAALDALWYGTSYGAGMRWWKAAHRSAAQDSVSADPLATAIQTVITEPFEGTAAELLGKVSSTLYQQSADLWSPQKAGLRLPRAVDALTKLGWTMERGEPGHAGQRKWVIAPPGWRAWKDGETWKFEPPSAQPVSAGIYQQATGQLPPAGRDAGQPG